MALQAELVKVSTGESISYWGATFAENGLFILLETKEHENQSAPALGPEILDTILTTYTNFNERSISTVAQILSQLEDKKAPIHSLTLGILEDQKLFLGSIGEGEALIIREGKIGTILHKGEISSGEMIPNDLLLFYPGAFRTMYPNETIPSLVAENVRSEFGQRLKTDLVNHPGIKGVTLLLARFSLLKKAQGHALRDRLGLISEKIQQIRSGGMQRISRVLKKENRESDETVNFQTDKKEIRSKRILIGASFILVLVLIGSIFLNINRTKDKKKQKELSDSITLVSHQYDEAVSLIDINPVRARSLLSESKLTLSPLLSQFSKNSPEYKQIGEWFAKIGEKEIAAYKIFKLTSVPLFFDLTFLKAGAVATTLSWYKNVMAILDTQNQTVYRLHTDTKESAILAGSDTVKDARSIAIHGSTVFLLNSDGIVSIDAANKSSKLSIKKDDKWGNVVSLVSYGGNLYLLDTGNNAIWKYIATDFGFASRASYLNSGVKVNLSDAKDLEIDGSVWVLFSDGVAKYAKGINDTFVQSGFSDTLSGLTSFSTSETDKNLYILDTALSRIVVFDKDGVYQSQYQWDELKHASDLFVSEDDKKIFVTVGSKIYGIDIK